jgi:isoleucyl-tRNA synthetase
MTERFRTLPTDRPAEDLEQEVLSLWESEKLFERVSANPENKPEFVFFEGPPTANGRPGIHHVFSRTLKDLFCRHRAMSGFHVTRKAGWDTHGLPVEIEVEKQLGISGKQQIEQIGVAEFNRLCRESVFRYRTDWETLSKRIGYWLDYEHPYVTYSHEYVESVWWALKTLFDKNRLYRGHKILPYCPRCGTALSSHEVAQGYKTVKDPSVYIALDLEGEQKRRILVWTTTPWTLVSNVALAVNPEMDYVELRELEDESAASLILAASRVNALLGDDYTARWHTVANMKGTDLFGMRYKRPLDWVEYGEGAHEIIVGESFVTAEDGSGVVHMAPAFGADDYAAGQRNKLAFLQPVDARGEFPQDMPLVGGMFVKAADKIIIQELKRRGSLWKSQQFEHQYPHCWRCETPLLYYARTSWFVRTTAFKEEMLARNSRVNWNPPETGEGRFGEWLVNNIDWAISRDRFWGTPLPLWICDADSTHVEAVGSYAELDAKTGKPRAGDFDPHKPHIDGYSWSCSKCSGTMRRVPEVIDTWFDSGSMSFAQWHFPFENREMFQRHYPADFIAEGVDQTRGWFYSLLAIATGLGDALPGNEDPPKSGKGSAPYGAVVVNDLVLDAEGAKMSKSKGNVVDPGSVIPKFGADAVRIFLVASSQVWLPRRFDENGIRDIAGRFLLTLKNVYSGIFALYANFGWSPSDADPKPEDRPLLDRWILSRLCSVERDVDALMTGYDATVALRNIMDFVVDDVSNWYVRLSRQRFYDVDSADNRAAFATLHEVLSVSCRLLAPFAPFVSDWIHRELNGGSVHVAPYVRGEPCETDDGLESAMSSVRMLAKLGRAAREEAAIKVRQPLKQMVCVVPDSSAGRDYFSELMPLLASELNVKEIKTATSGDALVTLEAKPNFRSMGKKFGKRTPLAVEAVKSLDNEALKRFERGERLTVAVDGEEHALDTEDLSIIRRAAGEMLVKEENGYFAAIDAEITPELRMEGIAREFVSRMQRMRKESGFAVSDRITVSAAGNEEVEGALRAHQEWIAEELLAKKFSIGEKIDDNAARTVDLDGETVRVAFERVG